MNKKAVVVYLDDTEKCIEEFSWLYKTWMLWEIYSEFDLVVYHNPSVLNKIPKHDKIVKKQLTPLNETDEFWKEYPYVNSFSMFLDTKEQEWISSKYDFILKTDCDVFLTKYILGKSPERLMVGRGAYMRPESSKEILSNIKRVQKKLKLNNFDLNHIGASIFGKTSYVIQVINLQFSITKHLLTEEWKESPGTWPGWNKGVASMYGIHMAVNNYFNNQNAILYSLDEISWERIICSDVIHIHAWHTKDDFSKHKWFNKEYKKPKFTSIPKKVSEYCLLIASHSLEELINIKECEPDKFSVILPTNWKSKKTKELILSLNDSTYVSEILLIDNDYENTNENLIRLPKVKYHKKNNIPDWEYGVKSSKNELISICKDNINFNVNEVFGWILKNEKGLGCVGIHPESFKSDRESIQVIKNDYHKDTWNSLIFFKKSGWSPIPKNINYNEFDIWITKTNTPYYSLKTKTKMEIDNGTYSNSRGFNNLINDDMKVWTDSIKE